MLVFYCISELTLSHVLRAQSVLAKKLNKKLRKHRSAGWGGCCCASAPGPARRGVSGSRASQRRAPGIGLCVAAGRGLRLLPGTARPSRPGLRALLFGVSEPGPVSCAVFHVWLQLGLWKSGSSCRASRGPGSSSPVKLRTRGLPATPSPGEGRGFGVGVAHLSHANMGMGSIASSKCQHISPARLVCTAAVRARCSCVGGRLLLAHGFPF